MADTTNSTERKKILECVTNFKLFLDKPIENLQEIYDFLNDVPVFISNFITAAEDHYNNNKFSMQQRFALVVYLTQYCSSYELFKDIHSLHSTEKETIFEIKRCICKQMKFLLDKAPVLFFDSKGDATVGSFLTFMDLALDKIAEIDVQQEQTLAQVELNAWSSVVEEILCLSMSIAQVAFDDDNKIITAGCRSVLSVIESLKIELNQNEPNTAMCNLVIDTCSDKLCGFEARVNTAVLRLCLRVFSEYEKPMNSLYDFCVDIKAPDNDTLDILVSEFDLHMDRLFQIGLFSTASSTIGKCAAQIKNIMTNFEFLEGELVPAFVGMTKDSLPHRKAFAYVLKKTWCVQVKLLRKVVHTIIEPSAYCKLIYEELKQQVEDLWQHILEKKDEILSVSPFVSYTKELGKMLTDCMESFGSDMQDSVKKQLEIVYKVLRELIAARDLLIHQDLKQIHITNQRIFKRCQVLLVSIKRLWLCTTDGNQENQLLSDGNTNNQNVGNSDTYTKNVHTTLNSIMIKSKKLLKDRSMCLLNSNTVVFIQSVKERTVSQPGGRNLTQLRNKNLRECSYRQKTFVERSDDISLAEQALSQMKNFKS